MQLQSKTKAFALKSNVHSPDNHNAAVRSYSLMHKRKVNANLISCLENNMQEYHYTADTY